MKDPVSAQTRHALVPADRERYQAGKMRSGEHSSSWRSSPMAGNRHRCWLLARKRI